MQRLADVT